METAAHAQMTGAMNTLILGGSVLDLRGCVVNALYLSTVFAELGANRSVKRFSYSSSTPLTDSAARYLATAFASGPPIESLYLGLSSGVSVAARAELVAGVGACATLLAVHFEEVRIPADVTFALRARWRALSATHCWFDAGALAALGTSTSIVEFSLRACTMEDDTAVALAAALRENRSLRNLCFTRLILSAAGTAVLWGAIGMAAGSPTLADLAIIRCGLSSGALVGFLTGSALLSLDLSHNEFVEGVDGLAEVLRNGGRLRRLTLADCSIPRRGADRLVSALATNKSLTALDLSGNAINGQDAFPAWEQMLVANGTLRVLNLARTKTSDNAAASIGAGMAGNSGLVECILRSNPIGPEGIKSFFPALRKGTLKILDIGDTGFAVNPAGKTAAALLLHVQRNAGIRLVGPIADFGLIDVEMEKHYRTPHIRYLVLGRPAVAGPWLATRAPLWALKSICKLLRRSSVMV